MPVVFVVRADPRLSADDVISILRGQVAGYKLPKEVHFIAAVDLPRTDTGKLKRLELEARLKQSAD